MGDDSDYYRQQDHSYQDLRDTAFRDDQIRTLEESDRRIRADKRSEDVSESIKSGDIDKAKWLLGVRPRQAPLRSDQSLPADYWTLPRQLEVLQEEVQKLLWELSYLGGHVGSETARRIRSVAESIRVDDPVRKLAADAVLLEKELEMAVPLTLRLNLQNVARRLCEVVSLRTVK